MSISIDRYVSITSGVAGAQAVAQRELVGLRFSTDPRVPVGAQVTVTDASDALAYFGSSSVEGAFATQYFGYISPAPASQAPRLRYAAYVDVARPARVYGAPITAVLSDYQAVTAGTLSITLAGVTENLTAIDLSTATTLALVASALQTAIAAEFAGTTVSYDAVAGTFNIVTTTTGTAEISIAAGSLAALLGWNEGAIFSHGSSIQTPLESFQAAEQVSDSFGSFSFPGTMASGDSVALAQYNASLNVKYMYVQGAASGDVQALAAALAGIASVGVVLNGTAGEYKEALPQAIMAATNYDRRNATVNYMYRQLGGFTADVTTDALADTYDTLRINYYGETSSAGQKLAFFQRGFLMGTATSPIDMNVHANEQWLKAYLTARLLSLQLSLGKIPANNEGRGIVLAQVIDGVDLAKFNGTISVGRTLTTAQQIAVTQITGDAEAWRDVEINGFWADVSIIEQTGMSGATEYVAQYILVYAKNDVVRKIDGSHNLI